MTTTCDFNGYIQTVTVGTSGTYHITVNAIPRPAKVPHRLLLLGGQP
jgi:hypothetical protein